MPLFVVLSACAPLSNDDRASFPDEPEGRPEAPACKLRGWWRFEEGEGEVAGDESGGGRNLELDGPTWGEGHDGGGLSFAVAFEDSDREGEQAVSWDPGLQGFTAVTVTAWVNVTEELMYGQHIAGPGAAESPYAPYMLGVGHYGLEGRVELSDGSAGYSFSGPAVTPGVWTHLAMTASAVDGTWAFFLDGARVAEGEQPYLDFPDAGGPFTLGRRHAPGNCVDGHDWCFPFSGVLDDVKVVSCALSDAEIARDHESGWPWG